MASRTNATASSWRSRASRWHAACAVLCVCRGMQLLNVAFGGDLIAHIPDHYGNGVVHRTPR